MGYKRDIKPGDKIRLTGDFWRYSVLEPGAVYTVRTAKRWGGTDHPDWEAGLVEVTEQDAWIFTDSRDADWGFELVE